MRARESKSSFGATSLRRRSGCEARCTRKTSAAAELLVAWRGEGAGCRFRRSGQIITVEIELPANHGFGQKCIHCQGTVIAGLESERRISPRGPARELHGFSVIPRPNPRIGSAAAGGQFLDGVSSNMEREARPNSRVKFLPSLTDFAFLMPIVFLFGRMDGVKTLLGDCDTGWHIRTGEWILANHWVPLHDVFSFSKPGGPGSRGSGCPTCSSRG